MHFYIKYTEISVVKMSFKNGPLCNRRKQAHPTISPEIVSSLVIIIILFAPLKLSQYLAYIDNVGVKSFVLVAIELLLLEFTFRCMVWA